MDRTVRGHPLPCDMDPQAAGYGDLLDFWEVVERVDGARKRAIREAARVQYEIDRGKEHRMRVIGAGTWNAATIQGKMMECEACGRMIQRKNKSHRFCSACSNARKNESKAKWWNENRERCIADRREQRLAQKEEQG